MALRYPMVKPWLEYHRVSDGEYEIENEIAPGEIDEEPLKLPDYFVDFMQKLDGRISERPVSAVFYAPHPCAMHPTKSKCTPPWKWGALRQKRIRTVIVSK